MSNSLENVWEQYVATWKTTSAKEKASLAKQCLEDSCVYTDPLERTEGHEALIGYMMEFQKQVPGGHFVTTYFLAHHNKSIAKWNMVNGEGDVLGDGISYGEYNDDNRLVAMTGFFQAPPQ